MKIDGGAIGILENESALLKWAVAGPTICDILKTSDSVEANVNELLHHHEDTKTFEVKFQKDKNAFTNAIEDLGNPFLEEEPQLVHIVTKQLLDEKASKSIKNAKDIGEHQFKAFVEQRLTEGTSSIYDTIKKNNLPLYRQKNCVVTPKSKQKVATLTSDCRLFSNLYIASQSREGNLEQFFARENHAYPVSLSEYGKLRKCPTKSDFIKCLHEIVEPHYEEPRIEMKVIDGAAFVNIYQPKISNNFGEYCYDEITKRVYTISQHLDRLDFVFDTYQHNSIKTQTRENRGTGMRVLVRRDTPMCRKFQDFMRNSDNKTELFLMIANAISKIENVSTSIIATAGDKVISNGFDVDFSNIMPCNHEEADTRLILHVFDWIKKGYKKITIVTVDTDVVVIALYHFYDLNIEELWIEYGTGQHKRWLPIHNYAHTLGEETCRALPFWFTITGCDTVSMFSGRGKKTAWNVWSVFEKATSSFVR